MIAVDSLGEARLVVEDLVHVHALPEVTLLDRCDRCGAASQVAVRLAESGFRLDLCGHHWRGARGRLEPLTDAVRWPEGSDEKGFHRA